MSTRAYSEINLHFVWHVKSSLPIITEQIEPRLFRYVRSYALQSKGLIFHEIGGTETHVHIAVMIRPTLRMWRRSRRLPCTVIRPAVLRLGNAANIQISPL